MHWHAFLIWDFNGLSCWLIFPTSGMTIISANLCWKLSHPPKLMEPYFLHGIRSKFLQCSPKHSQESKPQFPATCVQPGKSRGGGGWNLPSGPLDNKRSSLDDSEYLSCRCGNAGSFSLAQSQTPTTSRPISAAKQHYDHANPKMAFHFACAATCNSSQHGHRNLDKEGTIINTK